MPGSSHTLDRLDVRFDDEHLVSNGGLLLTATLGTFLRSFTFGHARQLDRVSRDLLARAWAAPAGPGDDAFTIDLDSTICETYGLAKQGGSRFTYTHVRGYHPLVAVVAGTGDVVHSRLRGGPANSGRGAGSFLTECFARIREAGATGEITVTPGSTTERWWGRAGGPGPGSPSPPR